MERISTPVKDTHMFDFDYKYQYILFAFLIYCYSEFGHMLSKTNYRRWMFLRIIFIAIKFSTISLKKNYS
jgi:hypothetical protein